MIIKLFLSVFGEYGKKDFKCVYILSVFKCRYGLVSWGVNFMYVCMLLLNFVCYLVSRKFFLFSLLIYIERKI